MKPKNAKLSKFTDNPPLNAFFFLQHKYNYKPFATMIVYKSSDIITI